MALHNSLSPAQTAEVAGLAASSASAVSRAAGGPDAVALLCVLCADGLPVDQRAQIASELLAGIVSQDQAAAVRAMAAALNSIK